MAFHRKIAVWPRAHIRAATACVTYPAAPCAKRKAGASRSRETLRRLSAFPGTPGQGEREASRMRPLEDQSSESASGPVIISSATLSVRLRIAASNRSQTSGFSLR